MLTEKEVNAIFNWQPYRSDWTVDRNQVDDNIELYYGELIHELTTSPLFETYYSEDGGLGNYLEFLCYPAISAPYEGNAILVAISLCAPVGGYGQTTIVKSRKSLGWGGMFPAAKINEISDESLKEIEHAINAIFANHSVALLDKEFVCRPLSQEVATALRFENHNEGGLYLHGLFQKVD